MNQLFLRVLIVAWAEALHKLGNEESGAAFVHSSALT